MNRILQIILIILLIVIAVLQILIAKGILGQPSVFEVCPVDAISMQNGKAVIDPNMCIGCRRCVDGVPRPGSQKKIVNIPLSDSIAIPIKIDSSSVVPQNITQSQTKTQPLKTAPRKGYIVDSAACIGCTLCVSNCPVNAISMVDGKAIIDLSKCISCGICVNGNGNDFNGCPVSAISVKTIP